MQDKKPVELIIFDLDGTLVDSRQDIANAVNATLKKVALDEKSTEEITSYIGTGVEDLIRKSLGKKKERLFEEALSFFTDYYKGHSADTTHLYPGVKETLSHFKNKRKIIITNRKYDFAVATLKALGLYDYFEYISGGDNLGCLKPSSCPLKEAMRKFKIEKEKTIIVGDMDVDVLAGKGAGISTCAVTYGIGKKEDTLAAGPDYVIDDISQLKDIIS